MALLVRAVAILVGTLVLLGLLAYLGLQIRPAPFASYPERTPPLEYVPLPEGLPAPVERFYRTTLGDRVPVIRSTVFSGRANLSFNGLRFPARWRFTHEAGQGYRHYIETTIYGKPLMKVNEHYLDGRARLELPMGVVENEPKVDMAANLGLWGESFFLPSILLSGFMFPYRGMPDWAQALGEVFPRAPHGEELPSLRQVGQEIQPMPDVKRISAPNAIRYQPNGLKSCVET